MTAVAPFFLVQRDPAIKHPTMGVNKGLEASGLVWYAIWS
jgi:hypothetical protein